MVVVTEDNCAREIERRLSDVVDLLAGFGNAEIDPRAWRQLLIYVPKDLIAERHATNQLNKVDQW